MKRSCLPDDWLLLILLILHFQQMWALIEGQNDLFLVIFCSLLSKIWWQILKKSLIFSTYLCHEAIAWRRKDCNSRPVKSDAFGVSLMHSRSNSSSHTGMWKSHQNFLIPHIFLFCLVFNITDVKSIVFSSQHSLFSVRHFTVLVERCLFRSLYFNQLPRWRLIFFLLLCCKEAILTFTARFPNSK